MCRWRENSVGELAELGSRGGHLRGDRGGQKREEHERAARVPKSELKKLK